MHDDSHTPHFSFWTGSALAALPLAIGGLLLTGETFVGRTVGTAFVGLGLYGAWALMCALDRAVDPETRTGKWTVRLRRAFPYLVLVLVCAALLWPCLMGLMPVSHDHPVHLTRAWHFVTHNLAEGRLSGWSDLWLAGWPSGEDYPPASDWWIAGFFLGTFGLLGWEASYAIAFFAMYAVTALSFFAFGRVYFGRAAGLLAGLFFLLDRGAYREGGWTFTVEWGVWPQALSLAFTLLSFAALDKVVRQARPRDFALCAVFTAVALLSHPVALLLFALGLPVYVAVRGLGGDEDPGGIVARSLGAVALGATMAAFWLLPFGAKAEWMVSHGRLWKSVEEMAAGIWSGALFGNVMPVLVWLGVLGAAVAVVRRHWAGIFVAVLMAGLLFLASSTAFVELDLLDLSRAFGQVTYKRLALPVKACCFLLAGFTLQVLFSRLAGGRPAFSWRRYAIVGLVSLAAAPFVPAMARSWNLDSGEGLGRLLTAQDVPYWRDYQQFLQWSAELEEQESDFYRIAYVAARHDHFFLGAPVHNGTPLYKHGFTPAVMFKHRPEAIDHDLLEHLSVKWVVALHDLSDPSYRFERRFGIITVYRFQGYSPQRYTLEGPGRVEVLAFEPADEEIRLRVSGADATSRLILHVAPYANWRATVDGKPLEITTARLGGHEHFMSVPARDGTIELDYVSPMSNVLGALLSWLAFALLGLMAWCRFRPSSSLAVWLAQTLVPWGHRVERHGVTLGIVLLGGLLAAALIKVAIAFEPPGQVLRKRLPDARVEVMRAGSRETCIRKRSTRFQCGDEPWDYVGAAGLQVDEVLRRCIWAHPVANAELRLVFPEVELGSTLIGHHGLADRVVGYGEPVDLEIRIDGRTAGRFRRTDTQGWEPWEIDTTALRGRRAEVSFVVTAADVEKRHYCLEPIILP
jgi:hypothetical protein